MIVDVDKIVVSLDVVSPDAVVVEASAVLPNDVEVDFDIELPVITISHEETPTVSPLEIIDYSSTSIECAFDVTTEQAEEVVKGVLCGTTNPPTFENADYRLLHGQGNMDLAFAGLHVNTEYYLRPYALSNLGYKYGDVVAQRTKASPIPDGYQLVEYLESDGGQYIPFYYIGVGEIGVDIDCAFNSNATSGSVLFGRVNPNAPAVFLSQNALHFTYKSGVGSLNNDDIPFDTNFHNAKINYKSNRSTIVDDNILYNITETITGNIPFGLFCRYYNSGFNGLQRGKIARAFISLNNDDIAQMYSVYRKTDNKPGMYDIVNNIFYTNQGTGEFTVGPDKEWEE